MPFGQAAEEAQSPKPDQGRPRAETGDGNSSTDRTLQTSFVTPISRSRRLTSLPKCSVLPSHPNTIQASAQLSKDIVDDARDRSGRVDTNPGGKVFVVPMVA